jgi:hypothetical protein
VNGALWPTPEQRLLLRAALLGPEAAREALEAWTAAVDIEDIDMGSYRLLPLLYLNLKRHGIEHPHEGRLKGNYRLAWYQNRIGLHHLSVALGALSSAGIETMALKGAALLAAGYCDPGARPMGDIDLLVRPRDVRTAVRALEAEGWSAGTAGGKRLPRTLSTFHAMPLRHPGRREVDLHWFAIAECRSPGIDDAFWAASQPVTVEGAATRALAPADQLLHVLAHGARWDPVPAVRWASDAMAVLSARGARIDWGRFVEEAARRRLTLFTGLCLEYLRSELEAPIPGEAIVGLQSIRPARLERWDYRAQNAPTTVPWMAARYLTRYLRMSASQSPAARLAGFPVYLQEFWGLRSPWLAPVEGARRVWGRLRQVGFRPWRPFRAAGEAHPTTASPPAR